MAIFFPSPQPSLASSCRNGSRRTAIPEAVLLSRKPMRKIFPVCWADAGTQSAKSMAQRVKLRIVWFIGLSSHLSPLYSRLKTAALTLPALVEIINKTTFVQFFNEAHIDKVLRFGSFCLGIRLR